MRQGCSEAFAKATVDQRKGFYCLLNSRIDGAVDDMSLVEVEFYTILLQYVEDCPTKQLIFLYQRGMIVGSDAGRSPPCSAATVVPSTANVRG